MRVPVWGDPAESKYPRPGQTNLACQQKVPRHDLGHKSDGMLISQNIRTVHTQPLLDWLVAILGAVITV